MIRKFSFHGRFVRKLGLPFNYCARFIWTDLMNQSMKQAENGMSNYYLKSQTDRIQECYSSIMKFSSDEGEKLRNFLSRTPGGLKFAMEIRKDVQKCRKKYSTEGGSFKKNFSSVDSALKEWLRTFFSDDALFHQSIQFDACSGSVLEFIARNDEVHQVNTVQDLQKRLTNSRRCYALFHARQVM